MTVSLQKASPDLLDAYFRSFETDPDLYMDMTLFQPYVYSPQRVSAYSQRILSQPDRVNFMVMLGGSPIGEIALKHIDPERSTCELSVHLQNDAVKNRGYGTQAERLAVRYAFSELGIRTVLADAVLKNARSQHVLEKVGFVKTGQDDTFYCYELTSEAFHRADKKTEPA